MTPVLGLDPELALGTCLDPQAIRPWLQAGLPALQDRGLRIESVRLLNVRRNSSRRRNPHPVTLCYELELRDAGGTPQAHGPYYAKLCRDAESARLASDRHAVHLPGLELLLWPWPLDPGLPQLPGLLAPEQAVSWWGRPADGVDAVRYEPEHRATLRYQRRRDDGSVDRLWAKTFSNDRGESIHRRFVHFWNAAQDDTRAPTVAQPLGYDAATRTLWQADARGEPLAAHLAADAPDGLPVRVAQALAALHRAPLALANPVRRDRAHWLKEIHRRQRKIGRAAPELADRAARLADRLESVALSLHEAPDTLIHGDCHPDQFWVDGARLVMFDFDECCHGDPMEDLAEFVTKLSPLAHGQGFATRLLAAYARLAPALFSPRRLQWHLAVQQLLQAGRAFAFQVSDWQQELERRLAQAESLAASTDGETAR